MGLKMVIPGYYALITALFIVALGSFEVFAINLAHLVDNTENTGNVTLTVVGILTSAVFMVATLLVAGSRKLRSNKTMQSPILIEFDSKKGRKITFAGANFTLTLQIPTSLMFLVTFINDGTVDGIESVGWVAFVAFFIFLSVGLYGIYRAITNSNKQITGELEG